MENVSIGTVHSIFAITISVVETVYNIDDIEDEIKNKEIFNFRWELWGTVLKNRDPFYNVELW